VSDAIILARAQFAFTIGLHIILPAFSIGLASYLMVLEALWLKTLQGAPKDAATAHRDRRFATREWQEQPYFALLKDAYLLYGEYMSELAELAQTDAASKKRLEFIVRQYIDAIAPSNFLATNPEALKLALESGGASLAQGLSNLAADAQRGPAEQQYRHRQDLIKQPIFYITTQQRVLVGHADAVEDRQRGGSGHGTPPAAAKVGRRPAPLSGCQTPALC